MTQKESKDEDLILIFDIGNRILSIMRMGTIGGRGCHAQCAAKVGLRLTHVIFYMGCDRLRCVFKRAECIRL